MPSKNSGRKITKLKVNKKTITLTFDDKKKLSFNSEVMANFYLYEGKIIDDKTLKKIKEFDSSITLFNYAMSIIKKGHVSEWKMREKLYAKEAEKEDVDFIIQQLKNIDLINDKAYIEDYLGYAQEKGYGKNKIKQELLKKGIFAEEIDKIRFNESVEKKKAQALVPALEKKYAKYSYEQKKQHIYAALLNRGFSHDVASMCLNNVSKINEKDEQIKIKNDYKKVLAQYKNKYEGRELNDKVFQALRRKGYRVSDIKRVMGGNSYDF